MALDLFLARHPSPLGTLLLVWDAEHRVRALDFGEYEDRMHRLLRLHYRTNGHSLSTAAAPASLITRLDGFFEGDVAALTAIEVACGGTRFQRDVWAALRRIPIGTTVTYGEIATAIGRPDASRAVGAANGANPIAIIVPCHRVVGASGNLTGYAGGIERKQWLLAHERTASPRKICA